jgi:hypothetical protein
MFGESVYATNWRTLSYYMYVLKNYNLPAAATVKLKSKQCKSPEYLSSVAMPWSPLYNVCRCLGGASHELLAHFPYDYLRKIHGFAFETICTKCHLPQNFTLLRESPSFLLLIAHNSRDQCRGQGAFGRMRQ